MAQQFETHALKIPSCKEVIKRRLSFFIEFLSNVGQITVAFLAQKNVNGSYENQCYCANVNIVRINTFVVSNLCIYLIIILFKVYF